MWRFDQLMHPKAGYYPGERIGRGRRGLLTVAIGDGGDRLVGARFAHVCPTCRTDLTDLVVLHFDACQLQRSLWLLGADVGGAG